MQKSILFVLSLVVLLVLIPGISLSEIFAEKLVVASGKDDPESRFSVIDKITGKEVQVFGDSGGFLDGIDFAPDGTLFASSNPEQIESSGIVRISFLINSGDSFTTLTEFDGFDDLSCSDIAYAPDGTLYCISQTPLSLELSKINFEDETNELIGITGLASSEGNGLTVSSDGTIYRGNQNGLYTLNPTTAVSTFIGSWNIPDTVLDECNARAMDFDSLGKLYAAFDCEEVPYLGIIDPVTAEIITIYPITTDLVVLPPAFGGQMRTDAITFSPYDFDFLVGTTYGTVLNGFDSISVSEDTVTGMSIESSASSKIEVCDNTVITIDTEGIIPETGEPAHDIVSPTCNDSTTINISSGIVNTEFEADNGSVVTGVFVIGDIVTFDSKKFTITNNGENTIQVSLVDELFTILPGETISLIKSEDHYLGYPAEVETKHDDHDDDRYSKYEKYLKYFKEHHPDKYKQYSKYLKYFKDHNSDKYEKYFKYATYFYDKYHNDDDRHEKLQVTLTDEFEENTKYNIEKLEKLFNPVDKNNEGIINEESHLVGYKIKKVETKHDDHDDDDDDDRYSKYEKYLKYFKEHHPDKYKQYSKYLKYFKDHNSDKYEKYFKYATYFYDKYHNDDDDRHEKLQVTLTDEFEENTKYNIEKLEKLFNPVDKNNEGIINEESHLVGYKIKKVETKHDDHDDDDDDDRYSKYEKYLKYFKEHHPDKYKQYSKYLKYFKDHNSDKYEKYFKYAQSYYEKYHNDDDDDKPSSHEKHENILVTNQFGDITVDIKKAKMLLIPSSKAHDSVPEELEDIAINHFKCYDAKVSKHTPKFVERTVDLKDQFVDGDPVTMKVKKPKMLCLPVEVTTSSDVYEIENEENSIMCYQLDKIKGKPKFEKQNVFTNNQFGSEELKVKTPNRLCVPSIDDDDEPEPEPEPETPSATLEIIKTTNNVDDNFSITITNNDNTPSTYSLTFVSTENGVGSSTNPIELIPENEYTITEDTLPSGFILDSLDCTINGNSIGTTFTPVDGDVIVCTVVNEFASIPSPTLTIEKTTTLDDTFGFTIINNDSPIDSVDLEITTLGGTGSISSINLITGVSYNVEETSLPPGFTLTDDECTINDTVIVDTAFTPANDDDVIICTFDNTFVGTATLTIEKIADTNGTFDFTITDNDSSVNPIVKEVIVTDGVGGSSDSILLTTKKSYTVTENNLPPGFTLDSSDCTINGSSIGDTTFTPVDGDVIVCTFVNVFTQPPTLEIIKNTNTPGTFSFSASAEIGSFNAVIDTTVSNSHGPVNIISENVYTVTENNLPPGFTLDSSDCAINGSSIGDTTFTPVDGDVIVCTFDNLFTPTSIPTLKIVKTAAYDGTFNFSVLTSGGNSLFPSIFTPDGSGFTKTLKLIPGNTYEITENATPAGVTLESVSCVNNGVSIPTTFTAKLGDVIVCTFVNVGTPTSTPTLTIVKNAQYSGTFNFFVSTQSESGSFPASIITGLNGNGATNPLPLTTFNVYTITENATPAGVTLDNISCAVDGDPIPSVKFTAHNGDAIVCTVTNVGTPTS